MAPGTAAIEYCTFVVPEQTLVDGPVIEDGIAGVPYTWIVLGALVPAQFTEETLILPLLNEELKLTVIALVPCPAVMVAVAGTVHI